MSTNAEEESLSLEGGVNGVNKDEVDEDEPIETRRSGRVSANLSSSSSDESNRVDETIVTKRPLKRVVRPSSASESSSHGGSDEDYHDSTQSDDDGDAKSDLSFDGRYVACMTFD